MTCQPRCAFCFKPIEGRGPDLVNPDGTPHPCAVAYDTANPTRLRSQKSRGQEVLYQRGTLSILRAN